MRRLTLLRHANATWKESKTSDFDRPLTRLGQAEASALARTLLRHQLVPDLIISSAAQRARQTAEIVSRELSVPPNAVRYDEALYLAEPLQILHIAQANGPKLEHLMIVGHNPCLSGLTRLLAPNARIAELDTATACTMTFETPGWAEIEVGSALDARIERGEQMMPGVWP